MKFFFALCCFLATSMLFPHLSAAEWLTDFQKAKEESARTGRPIFILFTNSDAAACLSFDRTIFSQKKFLDYADKNLVLMKADFPVAIHRQPRALSKQNSELRTEFGITVLPTMLLLDSNGKLYKDFIKADGGPEKHRRNMNRIMDFDPPKRYSDYLDGFVKEYKPPKPAVATETKAEAKPAVKAQAKQQPKQQPKPQAKTKTQEQDAEVVEETTIPDENTLLIPLDPEGDFQDWLKSNRTEQNANAAKDAAADKPATAETSAPQQTANTAEK